MAFVVLAPLLVGAAWGFAWLGHMADAKNVTEEAARAGARWLASHPGDIEGAKARAAEVVLAATEPGRAFIPGGSTPGVLPGDVLQGRLVKARDRYFIHDRTRGRVQVKPSSPDVKTQMDALAGRIVVAGGSWAEARVFRADAATTDPPETQTVQQSAQQQQQQQRRIISTNGALWLETNRHNTDVWSNPWSPPGGWTMTRVRIVGNSERFDFGYVYGWDGSSWRELARRSGRYDTWIEISGRNITQIRTRLTTDRSVLLPRTHVDVPEVEIAGGTPDYGVSYDPAQVQKYMVVGETYTIQVRARNTGSLTWTSRFGLSYRWYDRNSGRVVIPNGARDYVRGSVAPGQTYTFSLPVTAPSQPGAYTLVIDMVHEGVTWFGNRGCPVLRAGVDVPQGEVLRGLLTWDGADWWVGNVIVEPRPGLDISRLAGRNVILWGRWQGSLRFFRVAWIQEHFPGRTFDPDKDVLCNDPVAGDPDAPAGDPVGRPRTDGYAYCRVTYHYLVPLRDFWGRLSGAGVPAWRGAEPPSRRVVGEAFFVSGEAGER